MRYYLAGGALRDILLGNHPSEFDIVFDGSPEELMREHASVQVVGKSIPVYIVDGRDHTPLAGTIAEDLSKRDITINALLMTDTGIIHALPRTFADLKNGCIRHVSLSSFFDDPVRVFRAARFAAILPGFWVVPETIEHMRESASQPKFHTVSPERIGRECMKAMTGHMPGIFLRTLAAAGCLAPWLSPLDSASAIPAGLARYHGNNSVLDHIVATMDSTAKIALGLELTTEQRAIAVWMALCHDLGKTATDPGLLPRHIGHEKAGAAIAAVLAARLRLPGTWEKAGGLAASLHMKAGRYRSLRPGSKVDLLVALARSGLLSSFCAMVAADADDVSLMDVMRKDADAVLRVSLPNVWRNKGEASGIHLRELRARILAEQYRNTEK